MQKLLVERRDKMILISSSKLSVPFLVISFTFATQEFHPKAKKKNCYIGVTRPTLKLGPTLHFFFKNKKKKKKKTKK